MAYNFDKVIDRAGTNSLKWDMPKTPGARMYSEHENIVPMWVADMDFETPHFIIDAMKKRMEHPIFGYSFTPDTYFDAIASWQKARFGQEGISRATVMYQNSVLGGVASGVVAFTQPGDKIMVHGPTYTGFQGTVGNLGRTLVYSHLKQDENGVFRIDFEDMEKQFTTDNIPLLIFCSPHNPTGRVWEKWEVEKVVEVCKKHSVTILSDEIWADFILDKSVKHIPTTMVEGGKDITVALYAPSKTFNLAGLIGAYSLCYNAALNKRIQKVASATHYNGTNLMSMTACTGAYEHGAQWVDEMNAYILENHKYFVDFMNGFKGVKAGIPQATYLNWVNIEECGMDADTVMKALSDAGIIVNDGRSYKGDGYIRFNLACPKSYVEEACKRLEKIFTR